MVGVSLMFVVGVSLMFEFTPGILLQRSLLGPRPSSYLGRGLNETSTEGLLNPRSRDLQTLSRGFVNTSTEVFK